MQIDHVLYGVRDLADAQAWFAGSYGLSAAAGGAHPAWGTANAILPVGNGQYIELIAVVDPASPHPLAQALAGWVRDRDRPVAVALRPDDLDATARRLGVDVTEGVRENPDGVTLRWRMAGVSAALGADRLPFFIEWPGGGTSPELNGVSGDVGGGLEWVEIGGDADTMREWIGGELPTLSYVGGAPGVPRFSIRGRDDRIVVGPR